VVPKPVVGPADNEIWYTTSDGNAVNFYPGTTNTVLSNEYINGRGVIKCKEKITIMPGNEFTFSSSFVEERCDFINSITLPECCEKFGTYACCGLTSLNSINIPNSVTSIESHAFAGCKSLTSVTIPNSVTSIGDDAFSGCSSLPIENNLRYADTYLVGAVDYTLSTYSIKEGTKWIGDNAFSGCSSLSSITIPNGVTSIGYYAFDACSSLSSITIPNGVTSIGAMVFCNCSSLTSITYEGTQAEWNAIDKGWYWNCYNDEDEGYTKVPATYVQCSDGQVTI
jgi:hypothetical protein